MHKVFSGCILLLFGVLSPLFAEAKTVNDVFARVMTVQFQIEEIRVFHNIEDEWPTVAIQKNKTPSHVLQKCFEVLEKINRLRRIEDLGEITIPTYPARDISPNDVYDLVERLGQELSLLLEYKHDSKASCAIPQVVIGKTSNDIYQKLWEISYSLNPLLGMRGVSPNDAYALSEQILKEIRFLRNSQNLTKGAVRPILGKGKFPNHALQATSDLMAIIAGSQKNLWMIPVIPNRVPRRVITVSDVYDGLLGVQAELQRIKFRLGLERSIPLPEIHKRYDADDIIRNLKWAMELMPLFPLDDKLSQYEQKSLIKTPDHVFQVAEHILWELGRYKEHLGIRQVGSAEEMLKGLAPHHVYSKTLECLRQVSLLRSNKDLGPIALPTRPLRAITPAEVFELAARLDMELGILYMSVQIDPVPWHKDYRGFVEGKTPSDVFNKMQKIAREIDVLMGNRGYSIDDSHMLADTIQKELNLVLIHLDVEIMELPIVVTAGRLQPHHILTSSHELWDLLKLVQLRAGMQLSLIPLIPPTAETTDTDVYNELQLILTEVENLKIHLNMTSTLSPCQREQGKTINLVEQNIRQSSHILMQLLGRAMKGTVAE